MAKQQKRDNTYYEERLIRDYPTYYADYHDGKYRTITEAAIAAGLKSPRTRLQELKNAWSKASPYEQNEFSVWLSQIGVPIPHSVSGQAAKTPIAAGRHLLPWAKLRINAIMMKRNLKQGQVMEEMGLSKLDASVGRALKRNGQLKPSVIAALEIWLDKNKNA